jgi:hypothetical protein
MTTALSPATTPARSTSPRSERSRTAARASSASASAKRARSKRKWGMTTTAPRLARWLASQW